MLRHGRRAEVDEHDPPVAVEDQVGRLDVAVDDAVLVEHGQGFGDLSGPAQHARHRQPRSTLIGEQSGEVHALDPVEHQHVAAVVEEIVASVGQARVGWERQQGARLGEEVVG